MLFHGADIYAGYLCCDKLFIDQVEKEKMTQDFFTIEFTKESLEYFYPKEYNSIFDEFMNMLFFDALVGNTDRHVYNWGVVVSISGKNSPYFSKIYDSARGLLWNTTEDDLKKFNSIEKISNYCNKSKPKIGISKRNNINHFDLVNHYKSYYISSEKIVQIFKNNLIENVIRNINEKHKFLLSEIRREKIIEIITFRYNTIKQILGL
jgi:hypothetical protein